MNACPRSITELFGIEVPIIQAPMLGVVTASMVVGVAEAGGLGSLPLTNLSRQEARVAVVSVEMNRRSTTWSETMPYSFLVASWGGPGHLGPTLTAARQLRANGHSVRFIARADAREPVEAAGFGFATWQRRPHFSRIAQSSTPLENAYDNLLFGPAAARGADTLDEIKRAPTDALLTEESGIGLPKPRPFLVHCFRPRSACDHCRAYRRSAAVWGHLVRLQSVSGSRPQIAALSRS